MNTTEKKFSLEQITETISTTFTEEERAKIQQMFSDHMTYDEAIKLMETLIDNAERPPEGFSRLDTIVWTVRNAYINGAMNAIALMVSENVSGILELTGREPDPDLVKAIMDGNAAL